MAIDKYQPCPCGSGKKIKFCCTADLLGELEKLQRMLDGEQRLACLEHIVHLLEKHPRVPALLSIKAMLENELGNVEQADKTIDELLEVMPNSPVAMAERARLMAGQGQAVEAARCLQHALNAAEEAFPVRVYNVLGFVAGALLERGLFAAARAHFLLQVSLGGKDDTSGATLLMELNSAPGVSLLLKQDTRFAEAAEGASYKREFDEAMELVGRARWLAGHDKLAALAEKHGRDPAIRHNLAMLRCFLGQEEDAAKSWRICSSLTEPTSLEDAVEAEAMAQLLDGRPLGAEVPIVDLAFETTDQDRLMERLLQSKRLQRFGGDLRQLATDDGPPPRGVFSLLSHDAPASGVDLKIDQAPLVLCDLFVFGRETDRAARVETSVPQTQVDQVKTALGEIGGDALGACTSTESGETADAVSVAMSHSWRFPADTPAELRQSLAVQKREESMLHTWPTIALTCLDGKSAEQVQGDAKYRVRLLAAIFLIELQWQQNGWDFDFNRLRTQLQLPSADPIDPAGVDLERLPLVRYGRLDPKGVPTERLANLFDYAMMMQARSACQKLGDELVARADLPEGLTQEQIYGALARSAAAPDRALAMLAKARDAAVAQGNSPARWLLTEIPLCLQLRNGDRLREILETLQTRHAREPGVMQALMNLLGEMGLAPGQAPTSPDDMAGMPPVDQPAAGQAVWSPDAPQPAAEAPAGGSQSGLWLPGMD